VQIHDTELHQLKLKVILFALCLHFPSTLCVRGIAVSALCQLSDFVGANFFRPLISRDRSPSVLNPDVGRAQMHKLYKIKRASDPDGFTT
jgi:hypothetical protein